MIYYAYHELRQDDELLDSSTMVTEPWFLAMVTTGFINYLDSFIMLKVSASSFSMAPTVTELHQSHWSRLDRSMTMKISHHGVAMGTTDDEMDRNPRTIGFPF